jgi:DNA-binding MarR family transcriptional regulator
MVLSQFPIPPQNFEKSLLTKKLLSGLLQIDNRLGKENLMSDFIALFARVAGETKEACQHKLHPYGVYAGQNFLLELLWNTQEELTIGEIAARLHVEGPSITRTVRRMISQGLVEKYSHPLDARQVIVRLTPKGKELQQVIPQLMAECEKELLTNISDVERAFFVRLLEQMLHNLEQRPLQKE